MHLRRNRCAIDEQFPARVDEKVVAVARKHFAHGGVIRHNRDNNIRFGGDLRQVLARGATEVRRQRRRDRAIRVEDGRDMKLPIFQSARHIRAHSPNADKTDVHNIW